MLSGLFKRIELVRRWIHHIHRFCTNFRDSAITMACRGSM